MKFSIECVVLFKVVVQVQLVVEWCNIILILVNVLIEVEGVNVLFCVIDFDIEVVDKVLVMVEWVGVIMVLVVILNEIVCKLLDGVMVILIEDIVKGCLLIEVGCLNFNFVILLKEDFLVMVSLDYQINFLVLVLVLWCLFDKLKFVILIEEICYYLNGVYMYVFDSDGGKVFCCVVIDGYCLVCIDVDLFEGVGDMLGVIVLCKIVGELCKLLDDDDMQIVVSVFEIKICFVIFDIILILKVIDGIFFDYIWVILLGNICCFEVDVSEFVKVVDCVVIVLFECSCVVKLNFDEDCLVLLVNVFDSGVVEEELVVSYGDECLEIGFNVKYLLEIVSQVDCENVVFMFNLLGDLILMCEGNDMIVVYVVMLMCV